MKASFSILLVLIIATSTFARQSGSKPVIELRDFREVEVRAAGITLAKDMPVHISALGGGDKGFWNNMFDGDDEWPSLYAGGWIINAETREPVWEMTFDNTSGSAVKRKFDDDISLPKGSYELYFSAHGFERRSMFSSSSINIDRRPENKRNRNGTYFGFRGDGYENLVDEFMNRAKDWGITLTVKESDASSVSRFDAPVKSDRVVLSSGITGDNVFLRKSLTVDNDTKVHIYAVGEGRKRDEMFDYGWIIKSDTRERVWEMTTRNTKGAGGASKNRMYNGDVTLPKGSYELYYVTDDSHSGDDWNAHPPFDPLRYGITVTVKQDADKNALAFSDPKTVKEHAVVELTKVRDNDFQSAGFSLKADTKLHVYGIGEWESDGDPADYGWIIDAKTREHVWSMDRRDTYHAGGASKNRMVDEIITLPKGNYIAYYQTDGSHSYHDWNADPPYDEEHWGLTITGNGERFDEKSVTIFSEDDDKDVVAQITRAKDGKHITKRFTLTEPKKVRIYALGEGQDRHMYDYGWIENANTGETVWEMTYGMTSRAGGAKKNRMVSAVITLEKGEYELHYETDDSHAFNDWNDDPPEDRTHWGITLYKEK